MKTLGKVALIVTAAILPTVIGCILASKTKEPNKVTTTQTREEYQAKRDEVSELKEQAAKVNEQVEEERLVRIKACLKETNIGLRNKNVMKAYTDLADQMVQQRKDCYEESEEVYDEMIAWMDKCEHLEDELDKKEASNLKYILGGICVSLGMVSVLGILTAVYWKATCTNTSAVWVNTFNALKTSVDVKQVLTDYTTSNPEHLGIFMPDN